MYEIQSYKLATNFYAQCPFNQWININELSYSQMNLYTAIKATDSKNTITPYKLGSFVWFTNNCCTRTLHRSQNRQNTLDSSDTNQKPETTDSRKMSLVACQSLFDEHVFKGTHILNK